MTTGKTITFIMWTFVGKVMSLFFNMLSSLVITILPRRRGLLISWLQSLSALILKPKKIKSVTVSIVPHLFATQMGPDAMIFFFWMLSFKPAFHSPLSLSSRGSLFLFTFCHRVGSSVHLWLLKFLMAVLIPACVSSSLEFCMMYSA